MKNNEASKPSRTIAARGALLPVATFHKGPEIAEGRAATAPAKRVNQRPPSRIRRQDDERPVRKPTFLARAKLRACRLPPFRGRMLLRITYQPFRTFRAFLAMAAALLSLSSAANASDAIIFAGGAWAAIDRGSVCEAVSRSQRIALRDKVQAMAGVSFTPDHKRWGEIHVRLSRVPRGDATIVLEVGGQPFLLVGRGDWAWSRGPTQAMAIIDALRNATTMTIASRDTQGSRFSDPYLLDGFPTAVDSAAARCALRAAGKIR